ncbi:hypothetical protein F5Y05DRAFT_418555 [Hypoxylon sp. FL0543]|nr:hypothetical protein F5Y05DRAFT_418555 [Hypoxylon sp. FL0543]
MLSLQAKLSTIGETLVKDEIVSQHPEILAFIFDVSQLYREECLSAPLESDQVQQHKVRDLETAVIVKTKYDMFTLVNHHRWDLMNLIGIVKEECPGNKFQVPSPFSRLWPEFDAVRFSGYDESSAKRSVTILSLDYFSQSRTSLNTLSYEDKRVQKVVLPGPRAPVEVYQIQQATMLPNQLFILHDQWVYQACECQHMPLCTFGTTANLLVSGACLIERGSHGTQIKEKILKHYAVLSGQRATAESLAKTTGFSSQYIEWLNQELERACPACHLTGTHKFVPEDRFHCPGRPMFSFCDTTATQASPYYDFSSTADTLSQEAYQKFEGGLVSRAVEKEPAVSISKIISAETPDKQVYQAEARGDTHTTVDVFCKTSPNADSEVKAAKLAAAYYPRIQVPRISASGDLLYPLFKGTTQADLRLSYIKGGCNDWKTAERLLYAELVKAEDTLRAYRKSLSQNTVWEEDAEDRLARLFHFRSIESTLRQFYGDAIQLMGKSIPLHSFLRRSWVINGIRYPCLKALFLPAYCNSASSSLQNSPCPMVFGLGDAHGENVMISSETSERGSPRVLFVDQKFAGVHPVMLDLASPLYNDVFFAALHNDPTLPGEGIDLRCKVREDTIFLNFGPKVGPLTQAILDIKLRYLIRPLCEEAQKLGCSLDSHVPMLSMALLLCATLTRSFAGDEAAFLFNFAMGVVLSSSKNWKEFCTNFEELGFSTGWAPA